MTKRSNVEWLLEELPGLVASGVLLPEAAAGLRRHYERLSPTARRPLAVVLLAVFGSLLIGLGIILVLASNWEDLSRPVRAVLSFLPLLGAQLLAGYTLARRPESSAWREGSGTFLTLAVGACIALIGQIYNIPGNLASFLLTWTLLCLAIPYLLGAATPAVLGLAGVVGWSVAQRQQADQALLFWPLLALLAPFIYAEYRRAPYSARAALLGWCACIAVTIGLGTSLGWTVRGLWIPAYSGLFATLYLASRLWPRTPPSTWRRPFHSAGAAGTAVLAFIVSFEDPWTRVGWNHMRFPHAHDRWGFVGDHMVAFGLPLAAFALLALTWLRGRRGALLYGSAPVWAVLGYAMAAFTERPLLPVVIVNAYLLVLGIATVVHGIREARLPAVNGGMVILTALIAARFFDSDMSFAVRGVVFIVLGTAFLTVNLAMLRRKSRQPEGAL